jgi:hypothetical protein
MTTSGAATVAKLGQPKKLHDYGVKNGHPPIAAGLVMIDFDGTIVPWGPLMGDKEPEPGAIDAVQAFERAGYRIGIFTSRMSETWACSVTGEGPLHLKTLKFLQDQKMYVEATLRRHNIPFHFITAEKVPAVAYIDDKAYRYETGDWGRLSLQLLGYRP